MILILFQRKFYFKNLELREVIFKTFENRNTKIENIEKLFRNDFKESESMQKQWQAFLNRNRLKSDLTFFDLMTKIEKFIEPIIIKTDKEYTWETGVWKFIK